MIPNLSQEKKLWKKGYQYVIGLDESGRGSIAGPVVAAAVLIKDPKSKALNSIQKPSSSKWSEAGDELKLQLSSKFKYSKPVLNFGHFSDLKLRDSKKITSKVRERFYNILTTQPEIKWGIGRVSEKIIDRINILEATKLAMIKAIKNLEKKIDKKIDFLLIDGNFTIPYSSGQKSIIKADEKVLSCAIASIIAKVKRDRIMQRYHQKYPQYGFWKHKGYPTKEHLKKLKKYKPSSIHRQSFRPVAEYLSLGGCG